MIIFCDQFLKVIGQRKRDFITYLHSVSNNLMIVGFIMTLFKHVVYPVLIPFRRATEIYNEKFGRESERNVKAEVTLKSGSTSHVAAQKSDRK